MGNYFYILIDGENLLLILMIKEEKILKNGENLFFDLEIFLIKE